MFDDKFKKTFRGALAGLALGLTLTSPAFAVSLDKSVVKGNAMYDISKATYGVYTDSECKTLAKTVSGDTAVLKLTYTEGAEFAESDTVELKPGNYWVAEIDPGTGFGKTDTKQQAKVESTNTADKPVVVKDSDPPILFDGSLIKRDKDANHKSGAVGDATLGGAVFKIEYFDAIYADNAAIGNKTPVRTWYVETEEDGSWSLEKGVLASFDGKQSSELYKKKDGTAVFLLGSYRVTEVRAPEGYKLDPTPQVVSFKQNKDHTGAEGSNGHLEFYADQANDLYRGGIAIMKKDVESGDYAQGNTMLNAKFDIYNISGGNTNAYENRVGYKGSAPTSVASVTNPAALVATIEAQKVGDKWIAKTGPRDLDYGTYMVKEHDSGRGMSAQGMLFNEGWCKKVVVHKDGYTEVTGYDETSGDSSAPKWAASATDNVCQNIAAHLGIKFNKVDTDTIGFEVQPEIVEKLAQGQGNARLAGAEFVITNKSIEKGEKRSVWVDGKRYDYDAVVCTLVTKYDAESNRVIAITPNNAYLPYGTYEIKETKAPVGYQIIPGTIATITPSDFYDNGNPETGNLLNEGYIPIKNITMVQDPAAIINQ